MNVSPKLKKIYEARFFIIHLVKWDIKYKFRRSVLGIVWTVLQPLLLTGIIAMVFSFVFHQEIRTYAPYILSGVLFWDVLSSSVIGNGGSFLQSETYIRQFSHPVVIYPLRLSMVTTVNFLIATIGLVLWGVFVYPQNILIGVVSLPLTMFLYFVISFAISIVASHLYVRFRDYPYVMGLAMQLLWYLSPVFFKEEMFTSNELLHAFFLINPITHMLELMRAPFLKGCFADLTSYIYVGAVAVILLVIALTVNEKYEKTVIYYL